MYVAVAVVVVVVAAYVGILDGYLIAFWGLLVPLLFTGSV